MTGQARPLSIVVGVHHGNLRKCWACTIGAEHPGHYNVHRVKGDPPQPSRFELYERAVEYLEALPAGVGIRRPEVVRALGGGPTMFGIVQLAVRDMVLHGLLECVHTGRQGNCYEFAFRKGLK